MMVLSDDSVAKEGSMNAGSEVGSNEATYEEPSPPLPQGFEYVPGPTGRAVWLEVVAVLAIGVVPYLTAALISFSPHGPRLPYWLDASWATVFSACISYVTLYLIFRSGQPWERFGLTTL